MANQNPIETPVHSKRKVEFELPTLNFPLRSIVRKSIKLCVALLVIVALSLGSLILLDEYQSRTKVSNQNLYNNSDYQIVYLNNNLFYFCKLEDFSPEYVACNDSYYLVRKTETAEDGSKADKVYVRKPSEEELSKPEGSIYLLKENIVYIAKIGSDSSVLELINSPASENN